MKTYVNGIRCYGMIADEDFIWARLGDWTGLSLKARFGGGDDGCEILGGHV